MHMFSSNPWNMQLYAISAIACDTYTSNRSLMIKVYLNYFELATFYGTVGPLVKNWVENQHTSQVKLVINGATLVKKFIDQEFSIHFKWQDTFPEWKIGDTSIISKIYKQMPNYM